MKLIFISLSFLLLIPTYSFADDPVGQEVQTPPECIPASGGICLSKEQLEEIKKALQELDDIHVSTATITTDDSITIIQDWNGRVYTDGGSTKPVKFKLKIGKTVERDVAMVLKTQVFYRPKPPEPMFRLRIRAQVGVLIPEMIQTLSGKNNYFIDGGIGWDFFHLWMINLAAHTGVRSCGLILGVDLTKNFGVFFGPTIIYQNFQSTMIVGSYFSF
jgi:hypothetical protein